MSWLNYFTEELSSVPLGPPSMKYCDELKLGVGFDFKMPSSFFKENFISPEKDVTLRHIIKGEKLMVAEETESPKKESSKNSSPSSHRTSDASEKTSSKLENLEGTSGFLSPVRLITKFPKDATEPNNSPERKTVMKDEAKTSLREGTLRSKYYKKVSPPKNNKSVNAQREDVIFKILLRSVKRFYCQECCNNNNLIYTQGKEEEEPIFIKIDEICKQRFTKYFSEEEISRSHPLTILHDPKFSVYSNKSLYFELKLMIACLAVRLIMKKYVSKCSLKRIHTKYYDLISKFSRSRLTSILKVKSFQIIFEEFFTSEEFRIMLETDESLSKNKEIYEEKSERLIQILKRS
ncbi:unnamed protein product [Moneuplotes crassus]|uniref:Uncharacterized protein n=1 Tax=Euplotes crassus TaxID=5936 RepID=A0AAD1XDB1_EUPCR|nr:unnamed protein product [Moneuplotes crassus]